MTEPQTLSAPVLMSHVEVLANEIGPRPAGHVQEMRARQYVRSVLYDLGYVDIESIPFLAPDTWGYALGLPLGLALASNLLKNRLLGGLMALGSAASLWHSMRIGRSPLLKLAPRRQSATLVVRVPPTQEARHKLVVLAHLDSNKDRDSFDPRVRKMLLSTTTAALGAMIGNGLAQLTEGLHEDEFAAKGRKASFVALLISLLVALNDERGGYVDGANDNASAVACALGLAAQLREHPLDHTEVWIAFTGAEEVGCLGAHALLDAYGDELRDAWFLDFEMVGTESLAYVTRHTGFSYLTTYRPDPESQAWAASTAEQHAEIGVTGREMVIGEEVGALRLRGFRGLCLAGYGPDGWLQNWHQYSDNAKNIVPAGLEKAARFAWAMMHVLDQRE